MKDKLSFKVKGIILDTNFLMVPAQFGVDIIKEIERVCHFKYKLLVIDKTVKELESIIENQKGKNKAAAKLALLVINKNNINIQKTIGTNNTDDTIIETAKKHDYIIATQDMGLKRKAKEKSIPLIILRQKKYLRLENVL